MPDRARHINEDGIEVVECACCAGAGRHAIDGTGRTYIVCAECRGWGFFRCRRVPVKAPA